MWGTFHTFTGVFLCLVASVDLQAGDSQPLELDVIRQVLQDDPAFSLVRNFGRREPESDNAAREAILESREMIDMLAWLSDYFSAQAFYSQEELRQFVDRVEQMSRSELLILLRKLQQERARIQQYSALSSRRRERSIDAIRGSQRTSYIGGHRASFGGFSYRGYDHKRHYRGVLDRRRSIGRHFGRRW